MKNFISLLTLVLMLPLQASELFETSDMNVAFKKIDEAMTAQKKQTANERAQFYYEATVDKSSCTHCPEYLKLVQEVNKIVEKVPASHDVKTTNNQLIEIDRLKFLYFESVSAMNGTETCSIFDSMEPNRFNGVDRDKLTLLAEELISLPHVTTLQYYPQPPATEIRYLYRGEGLQSHVLIEVIVHADKTATLRYHHYDPHNLPDLGGGIEETPRKLNELEGSLALRNNIELDTKTTLNLADQSTRASLRNQDTEWIQVEARHKKDTEASVKAVLPVEIVIPSESGVKISGGFSQEHKESLVTDKHDKIDGAKLNIGNEKNSDLFRAQMERTEGQTEVVVGSKYEVSFDNSLKVTGELEQKDIESEIAQTRQQKAQLAGQWDIDSNKGLRVSAEVSQQTVDSDLSKMRSNEMIMSLTDHNHEYVTARVVQGDDLDRLIALSSRYSVGNNGTVNATVNRYDSGKESISFGHQVQSGKNSYQTSVGHDSEAGQFVNFKAERKISSTSSMVLSVQTDSNKLTTLMYQFESKF